MAMTKQTLVERLLAEGVSIAVSDRQSRTALLHSVIRKHDHITHLLLAHHSVLIRSCPNAIGWKSRGWKRGREKGKRNGWGGGKEGRMGMVSENQVQYERYCSCIYNFGFGFGFDIFFYCCHGGFIYYVAYDAAVRRTSLAVCVSPTNPYYITLEGGWAWYTASREWFNW